MDSSQRSVRFANCSGAVPDPGYHMYNQAHYGEVDVITGDYLAEINLGNDADAYSKGEHNGWIPTAWDGLVQTVDLLNQKRIKVVINGGSLNPKGLAEKTHELVTSKNLKLKVAYVEGDSLLHRIHSILGDASRDHLPHLDNVNANIQFAKDTKAFLADRERMPIVSAHAYLGARAIRRGLDEGADIIICGRVADASPVIGAAAWWHGWREDDYDSLAGALIAGHLIECSTYTTGANFSGFFNYDIPQLLNLGLPIAEVAASGECTITKHESLNGFVTADTVKYQLLYELQGNIYLNSDVKADIEAITVEEVAPNRVKVAGVKGYPPPPTTKLAVFYKAGYQCELLINATGYVTEKKFALFEAQMRAKFQDWGVSDAFDVLDFQHVGRPVTNPDCQLASTSYLRIFAQAKDAQTVGMVARAYGENAMQHFAGFHCSLDMRTLMPKPFLGFYPGIIDQAELDEAVVILSESDKSQTSRCPTGPPAQTEPLAPRQNYPPTPPISLASFGPTTMAPLGDIALARSGDKGANVNLGIFVHTDEEWEWLRSFMTAEQMRKMMGKDWKDWYYIERVELKGIKAVHFVVYGPLGRGVSSSALLDGLGKGFGEFVRDVWVPIPSKFLGDGRAKI